MHVFLFFLLISVRSAPSKPPATLPEEIIHCQYLLTSECVHKTHTHIYRLTHSHNALMARTVTLKCTHTRSNLNTLSHRTALATTSPSHCWLHVHTDVRSHTCIPKTNANTLCISIQSMHHCESV